MDLRSKNLSNKGMMVGDLVGVEKKEFLRLALAEANTERRDGGGKTVAVLSRMAPPPRRAGGWHSKAQTPQRRVRRAESQGPAG